MYVPGGYFLNFFIFSTQFIYVFHIISTNKRGSVLVT